MFGIRPIAVTMCGLFLIAAVVGQPDSRIEALVKKLGSEVFVERERSQNELETIGLASLPALERALQSPELEVRKRAAEAIANIEASHFARRLFEPKKIHIQLKDATVQDAVAELGRLSGYSLAFVDDPARFEKTRVTLDTGLTTFWQAFDQVCDATGLMEINEINERPLFRYDGKGNRKKMAQKSTDAPPETPRTILVVERDKWGKPYGVHYAGSLKIEAWTEHDTERKGSFVLFMVSAEPRLIADTVLGWPTIETALDEKDRKVAFSTEIHARLTDYQRLLHDYVVAGKNVTSMGNPIYGRRFAQIYVVDKAGASQLKVLTGSLQFQADSVANGVRKSHAARVPFRFEKVWMR